MSNRNNNRNTTNTKPANQAATTNKSNSLSPEKKNVSEQPSQKVVNAEPEENKDDAGSEKMEEEASSQGGIKNYDQFKNKLYFRPLKTDYTSTLKPCLI